MGTLYLVRHGQASFGAEDYDRLSDLGRRQCLRLGEHFRRRGRRFEAVLSGTLLRHRQSCDAIVEGLLGDAPEALRLPGLDEYDGAAIVAAIHPGEIGRPDSRAARRAYFGLLRQGLARWMAGEIAPAGVPRYADFAAGVAAALEQVRRRHSGEVLLVSSGGPIATAVGLVLATPPATTIELNMRIRNSAVTEFAFTPERHALLAFNTLPHLEEPEHADWVTYA